MASSGSTCRTASLHYRRIHGLEQAAVIPTCTDKVLIPALADGSWD